jgi:hypothetical protein
MSEFFLGRKVTEENNSDLRSFEQQQKTVNPKSSSEMGFKRRKPISRYFPFKAEQLFVKS